MDIDVFNIRTAILDMLDGLRVDGEPLPTSTGWQVLDLEEEESVLHVTTVQRGTGRTRGFTITVADGKPAHPITPTPATDAGTSDLGGTSEAEQRADAARLAEQKAEMARLVADAARSLARVSAYWDRKQLPDDFATRETGYPFSMDLEEQVARMQAWAEQLEGERSKA